jgi:hypothetical protein
MIKYYSINQLITLFSIASKKADRSEELEGYLSVNRIAEGFTPSLSG